MSGDVMMFPDTVEEFMEQYKVVDREQVYSNGIEFVPIFRMRQWFDHVKHSPDDARPVGKWIEVAMRIKCSVCGTDFNDEVTCCSNCYRWPWMFCPKCGAKMEVTADA